MLIKKRKSVHIADLCMNDPGFLTALIGTFFVYIIALCSFLNLNKTLSKSSVGVEQEAFNNGIMHQKPQNEPTIREFDIFERHMDAQSYKGPMEDLILEKMLGKPLGYEDEQNIYYRGLIPGRRVIRSSDEIVNKNESVKDPLFPADFFTLEQRKQGAVIFHILGVIYMFIALAIVCDEFFVPSLEVIIERFGIPDDVAGATFMAAGGSAPELFTSVIGVFVSFDDVGIGTIVGSAVFNILFVIGMCALFSRTVLTLTWWPLFRDCTFYSIALVTLVGFFLDNYIYWWEALLLLGIYATYVTFMKFNATFERAVKRVIYKNKIPRISSADALTTKGPNCQGSITSSFNGNPNGINEPRGSITGHKGSKFRAGLLQLMIHSIDPLHDGSQIDEKADKLHAIASLKVLLDATKTHQNGIDNHSIRSTPPLGNNSSTAGSQDTELTPVDSFVTPEGVKKGHLNGVSQMENGGLPANGRKDIQSFEEEENDSSKPLDMSWPEGTKKQITYIILAPIMFVLWATLPDARSERGKKFYYVTFTGSIMWIAVFSYLMVWWANMTGETFKIPPEIMGLTFLAAGTSIPDLITSVIVARKGLGDMAVSSSIGSNIFDVCVGLPLPWLIYGIFFGAPVEVSSAGMACSILILFGMLLFVVGSIACFKWKMNKPLGVTMFIFYFIFVAISLSFEYGYLSCIV
ncbi:sodium/potassium/calcium exchanger Nckx30C-like isoform X2 [Artemia franciscana]|uniref:Sodium/calcium exchanger membrane region domain-containing protein n=2 Tax=Artemia franciscana TaxID=6661 RepID=A0AA88I8I0_ARTSF|nr:hypothetical protein QYM36_007420 [Artemia franciscana]